MSEVQPNSIVTHIMQVSPTMIIIRVKPDGWQLPDFTAGQFIALGLPASNERLSGTGDDVEEFEPGKMIKRAYSIASSSITNEYLEFYITLVRSGALTPRIFNLKIGDRIELGKKIVGMFTLDQVPDGKNIILIATGTGVAPYISMLRSNALHSGKNKIAVIHGAQNSWDLGYSSELNLIQTMSDKFVYIPTILAPEQEPVEWMGETRFIQDIWTSGTLEEKLGEKPTPDNTSIFLCGNPKMTGGMQEILEGEGFVEHSRRQEGQIHIEKW